MLDIFTLPLDINSIVEQNKKCTNTHCTIETVVNLKHSHKIYSGLEATFQCTFVVYASISPKAVNHCITVPKCIRFDNSFRGISV